MNPLLAFLVALLSSLAVMPSVIRIAFNKRLLDLPGPRKIHGEPVPLLGGVVLFLSSMLAFTFFGARYFNPQQVFLMTSVLLLFFLGLRDDVHPLSPGIKLAGQLTAAAIAVVLGEIRVDDFGGCLGIGAVPAFVALPFTVLLIVFIINAVNFIDGIDGLAAALMFLLFLAHSFVYLQSGDLLFSILGLSVAGALAGFLFYNRAPARIYMGDAGSVVVGFLAAISSVHLCSNSSFGGTSVPAAGILLAFSALLIPVADALRLIILRIRHGRSPFRADTEHFHHHLMRAGWSANAITLMLSIAQAVLIAGAWWMKGEDLTILLPAGLLIAMVLMSFKGRSPSLKNTAEGR